MCWVFLRFDCHDFRQERDERVSDLVRGEPGSVYSEKIVFNGEEVGKALRKVNSNKAAGPDNVTPKVLKGYADQLYEILCYIFNLSLAQCVVPSSWKMSCIVPGRKRKVVTEMNDLRPVALTSCMMETFERVVLYTYSHRLLILWTLFSLPTRGTGAWMTQYYTL